EFFNRAGDGVGHEGDDRLPVEPLLGILERGVVHNLFALDIWRQVQRHMLLGRHHERKEETTDTAIAAAEGMDRFEMSVRYRHGRDESLCLLLHSLVPQKVDGLSEAAGDVFR